MPEAAPDVVGVALGTSAAHVPAGMAVAQAGPSLPTNFGWCASALPRAIARSGADVAFAPAYTAPLWGRTPLVATLHDVSYARRPEWYPNQMSPARQWFYRRSAVRSATIITDSEFSRAEITAAYGIPAAKIVVIPLGVTPGFLHVTRVLRPDDVVILHVGDLHPRRNLAMLLDVVLALRRDPHLSVRPRLVLLGVDRGVADGLRAQAASDPEALHLASDVDDATLLEWYSRASVFAYPSRYEGFGLPVLEAMAAGVPVVASAAASVPEVVGEAGLLCDPDDGRAWRDGVMAVLTNPTRAAAMAAAGRTRAADFTWARTAARTATVFRDAARLRASGS